MELSALSSLLSLGGQVNAAGSYSPILGIGASDTEQDSGSTSRSFADILGSYYAGLTNEVAAGAAGVSEDAYTIALGLAEDNLHSIEINAVKAELALSTLISVRNKALDAYSEIMRMTL